MVGAYKMEREGENEGVKRYKEMGERQKESVKRAKRKEHKKGTERQRKKV